nr:uncharacterized protein LOC108077682 [Drosophila kikkawai]
MFTSLLPLTMGSCYEVRTLAQIILHRLALECELNSIHIPVAESLISSVETLLGKKLYELQSEPRLILAEICMLSIWNNISDYILYMTNAPFDELYRLYEPIPHFVWNKIRNARQTFRSRKLVSSSQLATSHNLYKEVSFENSSSKLSYDPMGITIVVASLLDKETNFARLMLTCQRFGVDTLVLDEESHLEEYASGNIRISMVKSISLVEYLLNKRFEGYEIYACMETKDISRFAHYNFIKRGILVLGHKKNGIPANVDEILDNPVKMSKNYVFKTLVDEFMD